MDKLSPETVVNIFADGPEQGSKLVQFLIRAQLELDMILPFFKTEIIAI
jgi:hypothetical protein